MSHIPAYKEVYSKLKEELKEGIYPAGSLLPTESELEKIFHVSRTTIRKAISILSLEGYVKTKQGYGTEVLNIFTVQKLNQITSITETLRQKGYTVKTKSMYIEKITAPESIMSIMEMHTPAPIYNTTGTDCRRGSHRINDQLCQMQLYPWIRTLYRWLYQLLQLS